MKISSRSAFMLAIGIGAAVASLGESHAMQAGALSVDGPQIQKADWACGPGLHVNPWGRCVPNHWGGGYGYPAAGGGWGGGYGYPPGGGWYRRGYYDRPGGYGGWDGNPGRHRGWYKHRDWDD